jgi:hypothetical protein
MKRLLTLILFCAAPVFAQTIVAGNASVAGTATIAGAAAAASAPTFVQAQSCTTGAVGCNITITATTGNSIFLAAFQFSSITSWTISDTHNTYNPVNALQSTTSCCSVETFLATSITGGALTIGCTPNAGVTTTACIAFELAPNGTAISTDQVAGGGSGAATTALTSSTTSATTQANELAISCGGDPGSTPSTFTAGSGYTLPAGGNLAASGVFCEYKGLTATGTQVATATAGANIFYVMPIATFK